MVKNNKEVIPVIYCIDNNYAIPAAVCSISLLENASKDYYYKIYIINSDVSDKNKIKIIESVEKFKEFSEIVFLDNVYDFSKDWNDIENKSHFSKEILYKLTLDSIFVEYDKVILTDVDVVFLGDISKSFTEFDVNDDYYLAGIRPVNSKSDDYNGYKHYKDIMPQNEIEKLMDGCGAGYLVYNLKNIRRDDMQKKFFDCLNEKKAFLTQIEQDVLGICCYKKIKFLPLEYMLCTYTYDNIEKDKKHIDNIWNYTRDEILYAMDNTIQLHYACANKPWKTPKPSKSEIWDCYFKKSTYSRISLIRFTFQKIKIVCEVIRNKIMKK